MDVAALAPPKLLLAAARNIEDGGSLTVVASALVDTGSAADTLIHEELKSTGNAELRLDRASADRRTYPAVDIRPSGTRREELLVPPAELTRLRGLRAALSTLDRQAALARLLGELRATPDNRRFLTRLA
ncbi:hypothetical protein C5N14_22395 [Micromonospora sp. MW-13]|nr:hypothetical protein C5N14_22395 [Micromonospora sp. MW-13]